MSRLAAILSFLALLCGPAAAAETLSDNSDSVAIVVGNKTYKRTSPVDYALNDAAAMKDFLVRGLGFREQNVVVLQDATLNELNLASGTDGNPQGGRLWREAVSGRSNVFVYYSGHGVPDLKTRQPFLLPQDGDPNFAESGYALETLYRNLELVKQKVGPDRQVVVMIDACFTGETGRKGESLLSVSAPGFTPAKPKAPGGVIRLVATSGATPANWDDETKLGLFTSRFLMGAAGLAEENGAGGSIAWGDLQTYVMREVEAAARREVGREQTPEIDAAPFALPAIEPGVAIRAAVDRARDAQGWRDAERDGSRGALERYVARCGSGPCAYRDQAMAKLLNRSRGEEARKDDELWGRFGGEARYQDYLDACDKGGNRVCAYRRLALGYLGKDDAPAAGETAALTPPTRSPDGRVAVDQVPDRKPGFWQTVKTGFGQTNRFKECLGPGNEAAARKIWGPTCVKWQVFKTASGYELLQECQQGAMHANGKIVVTGDFDKAVRSELDAVITGAPGQPNPVNAKMVIETRRIGACPRGRQPGDTVMSNGQIVRNPQ